MTGKCMAEKMPTVNDVYKHHNGNEYLILAIANEKSTRPEYPVTVVYQGMLNKAIWAKTLDNFKKKMEYIGAVNNHGHFTKG